LEAPIFEEKKKPVKTVLWVLFWASVSLAIFAFSKDSKAAAAATADSSIKASSFGLKIANALRSSGWPDEATVFALATLPVLELRGAIPVGYWMKLKPVALTVLSILGLVCLLIHLIRFNGIIQLFRVLGFVDYFTIVWRVLNANLMSQIHFEPILTGKLLVVYCASSLLWTSLGLVGKSIRKLIMYLLNGLDGWIT